MDSSFFIPVVLKELVFFPVGVEKERKPLPRFMFFKDLQPIKLVVAIDFNFFGEVKEESFPQF